MLDLEKEYYSDKVKVIAGTDEAGRGPLAGPLVKNGKNFLRLLNVTL